MSRLFPLPDVARAMSSTFEAAGASASISAPVAHAILTNEAEANPICGFFYLPIFLEQIRSGRINATARPEIIREHGAAVTIDAAEGFAQPAIELASDWLRRAAKREGIAVARIVNSYNSLALSGMTEPLATAGFVAMAFSNSPAAMSQGGAARAYYGTNPFSLAAPRPAGAPIVIDQSASIATKTAIMMARDEGKPIPEGWACDNAGEPTTDPQAALGGYILPAGGQHGANWALVVEILSAALTAGPLSVEAAALGDAKAPHPRLGQLMLAIDPGGGDVNAFADTMHRLVTLIDADPALRLPGERRFLAAQTARRDGIAVPDDIAELIGLR
ncbi:MAG: Ldh family oxidoreductase [Pseudomonadota bacterium]